MIFKKDNCLIYQYDNETVQIEPWGEQRGKGEGFYERFFYRK